jgi:hypothetical protein
MHDGADLAPKDLAPGGMPDRAAARRSSDIIDSNVTLLYHRGRQYGILLRIGKWSDPECERY